LAEVHVTGRDVRGLLAQDIMPKSASTGPSEPPTQVVTGVADSAYQEYGNGRCARADATRATFTGTTLTHSDMSEAVLEDSVWDPVKGPTTFDAGRTDWSQRYPTRVSWLAIVGNA
jgi:hypothetical protein